MLSNGPQSFLYLTIARWACLPFSLLGMWACYAYGRDLFGRPAGVGAATLWAFSPNVLANAALITPDAAAAALGMVATYTFWKWLRHPGWLRAILAGFALGFCLSTKFTWIILIPIFPLLWAFWRLTASKGKRLRGSLSQFGQQLVAFIAALYVINSLYAFQETMLPLKELQFDSESGKEWMVPLQESWLGHVPVPLPRRFPEGIDLQKSSNERPGDKNYLNGEFSETGWWYYYLYGMAIKMPVETIALLALAVGLTVARLFRRRQVTGSKLPDTHNSQPITWRDKCVMFAPGLLLFAFVSSQTEMNRHVRYVLPTLPFLFVFAASATPRDFSLRKGSRSRWRSWTVILLLAAGAASSLRYYPHSHAYFNELIGGPRNGHHHLLNSNIDWGQQAFALADFVKEREQADEDVRVFYFGPQSTLEILEIEAEEPRHLFMDSAVESPPPPGWYAISVELLHRDAERTGLGQFLHMTPERVLGYSIYIYQVE